MRLGPAQLVVFFVPLYVWALLPKDGHAAATVTAATAAPNTPAVLNPNAPRRHTTVNHLQSDSKAQASSRAYNHSYADPRYVDVNRAVSKVNGPFEANGDADPQVRPTQQTNMQSSSNVDDDMPAYTTQVTHIERKPLTSENHRKEVATRARKKLTVGYLTAIKGDADKRTGLTGSGALTLALAEINNSTEILPNVELVLRWNDTKGDTVTATRAITEMICEGVSAFFGPEGSCYVEAIVAQSRNIPMISYKCSDYKASKVETFARTEPPDTQVTTSVISLLKYYDWKKFAIIHEDSWQTVASSLVEQSKMRNMTITYLKSVMDRYKCCQERLPCCQSAYWYNIIQETKNKTRIYVFLGTSMALIELMNAMQAAQLFDKGEYMVITVDMDVYSEREAHKYLWSPTTMEHFSRCTDHQREFQKRGKSLFVVVVTPPTDNYDTFINSVREYTSMNPFNFSVPPIFNHSNFRKVVPINAAYLYDSVQLYARALHTLLSERPYLTDDIIDEIASNGTKIVKTIIALGTYISITGATTRLDQNGDSEGNFSVLALTRTNDSIYNLVSGNFSCEYQMRPVGQFQQGDFPPWNSESYMEVAAAPVVTENNFQHLEEYPAEPDQGYQIYSNVKIEWPGDNKPSDEPSCGFDNEMCRKSDTHLNSIIAAGTLAIMLFCAGVITMSIYRKWKIEQEIEGLLWKIDRQDIKSYYEPEIMSSPSRLSLVSASVTSYESRTGAQVFATTAHYKGLVTRIKELNFARKKDISRDVMKEMRLLRDLRHDNINSFIGACIEPMSILLVTDYCAKGSLYDIIENEDIKLDKMFIASLVHDLIKGMLYIHNSMLVCHGNLKSSNCVVTSRWVLQVTDFGLHEMRHCAENDSIGEHQYYRSLFWKAPELLRNSTAFIKGTQKGDVYAFAIILYEIIGRKGPFGTTQFEPKDIIELVKNHELDEPFRPDTDLLLETEAGCEEYVLNCMTDCWCENPDNRPDFASVRARLKKMKDGKNRNIMDQMMEMMVKYADNLEEIVEERTRLLYEEKMKTEDLLHRMLPKTVAVRLTKGHGIEPEWFDQVTIYFSDIVGFTAMSAESTPLQVVNFLNDLYTIFDRIIKGYDVYKVETIGDAYMVVSGLPIRNEDKHAGEIASMALNLLAAVKNHSISHRPKETLKLRIGIHTGPVVAGVVGLTMPRYCLFGDTVNTASRMESNGEPLKIHISPQCKQALDKVGGYVTEQRGLVNMKGKGEVMTYWLKGATDSAIQRRDVDMSEIPPLFCRPRKSPKMNNMGSRQPSVCGILAMSFPMNNLGAGSRRHSSVPRGTSMEVDSTSTLHNSSPVPGRQMSARQHINYNNNNHHRQMAGTGGMRSGDSKQTIDSTFGSQTIDVVGTDIMGGGSADPQGYSTRPSQTSGLRARRVLSSIASSTTADEPAAAVSSFAHKVRESRSLDPLPLATTAIPRLGSEERTIVGGDGRIDDDDVNVTVVPKTPYGQQCLEFINRYQFVSERSTRSLDQCGVQIFAVPMIDGPVDDTAGEDTVGNYANGNIFYDDGVIEEYPSGVDTPLLNSALVRCPPEVIVRSRRPTGAAVDSNYQSNDDDHVFLPSTTITSSTVKRWRSLESIPASSSNYHQQQQHSPYHRYRQMPHANNHVAGGSVDNDSYSGTGAGKNKVRHSIRSWLVGLFNGNGLKTSSGSLRRGGAGALEYNNLKAEKESIV